jgi:hypothetical protein
LAYRSGKAFCRVRERIVLRQGGVPAWMNLLQLILMHTCSSRD